MKTKDPYDLKREWEMDFAINNLRTADNYEELVLWLAAREIKRNTPMKGKTLKESLSAKSTCCCDTVLVCSIHDKYISQQS